MIPILTQATTPLMIIDEDGDPFELYSGSYALLIGVSNYTNGWPDLDQIPSELKQLETALEENGFEVTLKLNPDGNSLDSEFKNFINKYGYRTNNRLLFYYAGHGHTWIEGNQGYLVPADAPKPVTENGNPGESFLKKALQMSQMLAWSRQMTAMHILFMFDSCFSGTVFKTRGSDQVQSTPRFIARSAARKVRQFITAGSAGERVPAKSVFTPAFVNALRFGNGDINRDHYITGAELGLHLQQLVPEYAEQTPQFGKHPDYQLSRGDFVFTVGIPQTDPTLPKTYALSVNTEPKEARVRILNIAPKYKDRIRLKPGRYHIEVTNPEYVTHNEWMEIKNTDRNLIVRLQKNYSHEEPGATSGSYIDDQLIETKAKYKLLTNPGLKGTTHFNVTSVYGVVLLTGEAPQAEQRRLAIDIVQDVAHVRQIVNEIRVAGKSNAGSRANDALLTSRVKARLFDADNFDATRIKVITERRIVYLMGLLSRIEGDSAAQSARVVAGVERIVKVFEYIDE